MYKVGTGDAGGKREADFCKLLSINDLGGGPHRALILNHLGLLLELKKFMVANFFCWGFSFAPIRRDGFRMVVCRIANKCQI